METEQTQEYYIDEEMNDSFLQPEDAKQKDLELTKNPHKNRKKTKGRGSFADGLAAGLGIGSIACFAIVWLALFFSPLLPQSATYENLLSTFIYLLVFLLIIRLNRAHRRRSQGILSKNQIVTLHKAQTVFSDQVGVCKINNRRFPVAQTNSSKVEKISSSLLPKKPTAI